jgi:flavin reductase (DIM6/NTAB) family NADH-FMN oxidoreductase RutF
MTAPAASDPDGSQPSVAVDAAAFKAGMRCLASGVTIITTMHEGQRAGLTATAVCRSVGAPQLLVCISHRAEAHDIIHRLARAHCWRASTTACRALLAG